MTVIGMMLNKEVNNGNTSGVCKIFQKICNFLFTNPGICDSIVSGKGNRSFPMWRVHQRRSRSEILGCSQWKWKVILR